MSIPKKKVSKAKKVTKKQPIKKDEKKLSKARTRTEKQIKKESKRKPPKPKFSRYKNSKRKSLKQRISENKKGILYIIIALLIIALIIFIFFRMFNIRRANNIFAKDAEKMQKEIENPIFKVDKIMVYSDADVKDYSENADLSDVDVSQYTDLIVYIDNKKTIKDLTEENTVNQLYIDNISVTGPTLGSQKVSYKNINDICKYVPIDEGSSRIDYKIFHKNKDKEDYVPNNFYTDCSEPFALSYVNENIVKAVDLSQTNEKVSLDGSILQNLGISIDELNYRISFTINLENNLGELFKCDCNLKINLDSDEGGIYTGYIMQIYDTSQENFIFRKVKNT